MNEMNSALKKQFDDIINNNKVVLFMKGDRDFPQCGFSAKVVQILDMLGTDFKDINVLDDMAIRQGIKEYSDWPTIPQLYINKTFVGGCDIISEAFQSGELKNMLKDSA